MGVAIPTADFTPDDYVRFSTRLRESLVALREVLQRPGFGAGPTTLGAELELFLVDGAGQALPYNKDVLAATKDPRVTLELTRYNVEVNARPLLLAGNSLTGLRRELEGLVREVERAAEETGSSVAMIGILPTLTEDELGRDALTRKTRYRALSAGILGRRDAPLDIHIEGAESLHLQWDQVTLQGANTSFQLHLRVEPSRFAAAYNAAQLATAPTLAMATNSPLFLTRKLWEETRIALFSQSVDDRGPAARPWHPNRCGFGHGWVREGILELFQASVALHAPLLPVVYEESPLEAVRAGRVPKLDELKLHQGTVWTWNRAIYDDAGGGHVRIEVRPLPAGPSIQDMVAHGAFLMGLTLALTQELDWMLPAFPFAYAQRNFYLAAKQGLDAELLWPSPESPSPRLCNARSLILELLPLAARGLRSAGVDSEEVDWALGLVEARVAADLTGARWQLRRLAELEKTLPREAAIRAMFQEYREHAKGGQPVHRW